MIPVRSLYAAPLAPLALLLALAAPTAAEVGPCSCPSCPGSTLELEISGDTAEITLYALEGSSTVNRRAAGSASAQGYGVCWTPCGGLTWGEVQSCVDICCTCGSCP
jgi:hypothetical protein